MAVATWVFLRQVESLRVAMATALQFGTVAQGVRAVDESEHREWMRSQGLECDDDTPPFVLAALTLDLLKQPWGVRVVSDGQRSANAAVDIGRERSGADFDRQSDFVLTSASVRLLGAHE